MTTAQELRIGNWVKYDNRLFQIESIARSFPCLNTDEFGIGVVDWNNINPIPITPEILEKCGFVYWELEPDCTDPADAYWVHRNFKFAINNLRWTVQVINVKVKYIHQLQNLYFALTGEELTFKH